MKQKNKPNTALTTGGMLFQTQPLLKHAMLFGSPLKTAAK